MENSFVFADVSFLEHLNRETFLLNMHVRVGFLWAGLPKVPFP